MGKPKSQKKPKIQADKLASKKTINKPKKKLNPFEVHVNKEKFTVLNRKLKHDKGMPGISRSKAIQKRKKTLGAEFKVLHKNNKFSDNRIGKYGMSKEQAADARLIAERLSQFKSKRQAIYNLNEDEVLTHKGQTLEEIEQFHDTISDEDDDDEIGKLDAEFTETAHFGGDGDEIAAAKRKSAIDDLIAETKRRKAEVSKEKEEVSELTHKLDESWKNLIPLMKLDENNDEKPKPDDFDRALKEMVFEPRGTVTDKLKSEEKLLRTEKWRLQSLEMERIDRMKGLTEDEKKPQHRSADDLDDGYYQQFDINDKNITPLAYDEEGIPNRRDDDSDDELDRMIAISKQNNGQPKTDEEEENDKSGEEETEENSDDESEENEADDDDFSDLVYHSPSEDELRANNNSVNKKKSPPKNGAVSKPSLTEEEKQEMMEKAAKELPYTFELPNKYDELKKLLSNRSAEHQSVIMERMIKCNHPKVEPANKDRMVPLFAFMLQHLNDVASNTSEKNASECFAILERLAPYFYDLSHLNPTETSNCFLEVIKEKQSDYRNNEKQYPSLDTLVFLKLASHLYSTSDFRHPIITPIFVFISQMLSKCRVTNRSDIAIGLYLVTIIIDYTQLSKRFLPAAINFLTGVLYLSSPKRPVQQIKIIPPFKSTAELASLLVLSKKSKTHSLENVFLNSNDLIIEEIDDSFKIRALNTALLLTNDFLTTQKENACAKLLIENLMKYFNLIDFKRYPLFVINNSEKCSKLAKLLCEKYLIYLVPVQRKPKQLRTFEPMIEKVYDDKRNRRPGQELKGIRDGLKQKIKRETKGAVREIRRDNAYLAKEKLKRQMQSDAERREKVKRIFSEASIQQGELNAMDRKKKHL